MDGILIMLSCVMDDFPYSLAPTVEVARHLVSPWLHWRDADKLADVLSRRLEAACSSAVCFKLVEIRSGTPTKLLQVIELKEVPEDEEQEVLEREG